MGVKQKTRAQQKADELRSHFDGPMSQEEIGFLRDVAGFVRFAIDNGLNFSVVMSALGHDINEILRNGMDLKQAKSENWRPKVSGYADLTDDIVGEPDDLD